MKTNTKPAPTRCLRQQGFRDALQRLTMTLMLVMMTATAAWADVVLRAYTDDVLSNAGGTIAFVSDQDHNNIVVTPNQFYYIEKVIHEYSQEGTPVHQILNPNYDTGHYIVSSNFGGTVTAYFRQLEDVRVSFNMNGHPNAANAPAPQDLKLGDKVTRPAPDPTDDDYVFVGWYTNAACTTPFDFDTTLDNSLSYSVTNNRFNLRLYAKWIKNDCTVTFDANGGTGTMSDVKKPSGTEFVIPTCGFSYDDGYFCAGWATSADGEIVYHPGDKITLTDDLTLYAKWLDVTISGTCGHVNIPTGLTGSEVTWRLTHSEGSAGYDLLTISSSINNGWIANYGDGESPWYAYREQIKTIVIGDGISTIGQKAFKDCTGVNSVSFGNSVNTIYLYAFSNCTSLTSVILPPSMREICGYAFRNTGLTSVTLNDGLQSIEDGAFYECAGLTSVSIPASVTHIGDYAFHKTGLTSVSIPASVRVIGRSAFQGCSSLQSVTIFAPELDWYSAYAFAFDNNASGRKIYVFSDCVETYQSGWSKYANAIEAIPALAVRDAGGELGSWCTYYNGLADVTVAEGTTVYTAKQNNAGGVTLTETGSRVIKRGEAVLLKSAANVDLSSAASSGDGVYTGNELKGVDCETAQDANTTYYVLSKVNGVFGFYKLKNTVNLGANKAYLAVATPPSLAPAYFGFDEGTTNILNTDFTDNTDKAGAWYTLDGRKLQGMPTQKGLYIVNGKKIVIK